MESGIRATSGKRRFYRKFMEKLSCIWYNVSAYTDMLFSESSLKEPRRWTRPRIGMRPEGEM
jgi:hypothetical protein